MSAPNLDAAVLEAVADLRDIGVPNPDILCLLGTGTDSLPRAIIEDLQPVPLEDVPGTPDMWKECTLRHGLIRSKNDEPTAIWVLEDIGLDAPQAPFEQPFERGFPCWMASFAGASLLIHTSAAGALADVDGTPTIPTGQLAVLSDHINLSGSSPLSGLGPSKLGPLFPDVSQLHAPTLRREALDVALAEVIPLTEAIVACAAPVSLATAAERAWFRTAGAHVWVQGIANPLIAAAHAGLSALALTAVTAECNGTTDIPAMLAASAESAPKMQALLQGVLPAAASFAKRGGTTENTP